MIDNKDEHVVVVENLSKKYNIINSPMKRFIYYTFKQNWCVDREFVALNDINFTISKGETFGIIGVNGSGKSTLLQILAGIIQPSGGSVKINGKISALLELGSGFNPESTGLENVYMNAAILGVKKEEIEIKLKEIIEFADIGDFINQPVKTYSSGMFIRLAFAVAINVDAEIIIIDEALAVGDIFFRQKCYDKLNSLKEKGCTIILVSHSMNEVEQFCDNALFIANGKQIAFCNSSDAVQQYYMYNQGVADNVSDEIIAEQSDSSLLNSGLQTLHFFENEWCIKQDVFCDLDNSTEHSNGKAKFVKIGLFDKNGKAKYIFKQGEYAYFYSEVYAFEDIEVPANGVVIINDKNIIVHGKNSFQSHDDKVRTLKSGQTLCCCIKVKLDIQEGEYTFESGFSQLPKSIFSERHTLPHANLDASLETILCRRGVAPFSVQGHIYKDTTAMAFYGLTNLKSEFSRASR